jgi:hypothetical protein
LNDEFAEACERDGEFLAMAPAMIAPDLPPEPATPPGDVACEIATPAPEPVRESIQALYLEAESGTTYEIRSGWVIGQAHPTSAAQVQLSGMAGLNFVHRSHCQFELRPDGWHAIAVAQPEYANPTFVNQTRLMPGQDALLRNGDRLVLANVPLSVRILEV